MSLIANVILLPVIVLASIAIISSIYYIRQQNINLNQRVYQLTERTSTERYKLDTTTTTRSIASHVFPDIQCNCQILPNCPHYVNSGKTWDPNQAQKCGFDPSTFSIQICCPVDTSNKPLVISIPKPEKDRIISENHLKPVQSTSTVASPPSSMPTSNLNQTIEEEYPVHNIDIRTGKPKKPSSNYLNEFKDQETEKPEIDTLQTEDEQMNDSELIFILSQLHRNAHLSQHKNFELLPQSTDECGSVKNLPLLDIKRRRRRKRVVGGMKAPIEKYPWLVKLYYNNTNRCETEMCLGCLGTVINYKYVLTTAHCARLPMNPMIIVAGEGRNTRNYSVEKILPHPDYDNVTKHHDIALVRIRENIIFGGIPMSPVCLPFFDAYHLVSEDELTNMKNNEVLVAGWGVSNSSDTSTIGKELREAVVPEWPIAACQKTYEKHNRNKTITVQQFCTGGDKKTKSDACWGDSGGGIYTLKSMIQVGIVSYGFPSPYQCGDFPGVNTRVIFYLKWILDSISP